MRWSGNPCLQAERQLAGRAGVVGVGIGGGCIARRKQFRLSSRLLGFPEGCGMIQCVFCKDDFVAGWRMVSV